MSKTSDFKKKVEKKYPSFIEAVVGLPHQELEKSLLIYSKHREDAQLAQSLDKGLQEAKDIASALNRPYSEAISALKDKMKYINLLIREANGQDNESVESEQE